MAFDFGDLVPLTVQITDAAGAPANPGGITLTITLPDGTTVTLTPTQTGTGLFQVDYAPTMAGRHPYRWVATGANASAYSGVFDVRPADPGYIVSLADAKAHLNKTTGNSPDDEELRGFVEYATEQLDPYGVQVSAALFGLSATRDMGIGQRPSLLGKYLDTIYPMVYPSHYGSGEYNIEDPDAQHGRTVSFSLLDFTS